MATVTLANAELPPVYSCLFHGNSAGSLSSSMKRAILEIIVSKVASTPQEVEMYAQCTLLAASLASEAAAARPTAPVDKLNAVKLCVNYLEENEFIVRQTNTTSEGVETETFEPTQLGSAIVASGLSPDEGLVVFAELQKARRCFVLENELHTVYLVTPIDLQDQWSNIDWMQYLCLWEQLPVDMKRVAEFVGIQERVLGLLAHSSGNTPGDNTVQQCTTAIHRRFYAAMALHDLASEMPLTAVVKKYGSTRGVLQSLQQSAATFAGMVTVFCARLGWYNVELLLTQFQSRLSFGVQRELVDLVRLSPLNAQRARAIFNAGYQTVAALASAEPAALELVFRKAAPFRSKKKAEDEADWELAERIWVTGQKGLTEYEAAVLVVQEAKKCVADDLLQMGIEWKPQTVSSQASHEDELDLNINDLKLKSLEEQLSEQQNVPASLFAAGASFSPSAATAFANPGTMQDGNSGMSEGGCLMASPSLPSVPNGCANLPIRPLAAVPGPGLTAQQQQRMHSQQVMTTPCCTPKNLQSAPTMTEFSTSADDGSDSASCGADRLKLLMTRSEAFLENFEELIREMERNKIMYSDVTDVNAHDVKKVQALIESHLLLDAGESALSDKTQDAGKLVFNDIKRLVSFGIPASVDGVARSACEAIERLLDLLKTKRRQMFEIWLHRYIQLQRSLHSSRLHQIQLLLTNLDICKNLQGSAFPGVHKVSFDNVAERTNDLDVSINTNSNNNNDIDGNNSSSNNNNNNISEQETSPDVDCTASYEHVEEQVNATVITDAESSSTEPSEMNEVLLQPVGLTNEFKINCWFNAGCQALFGSPEFRLQIALLRMKEPSLQVFTNLMVEIKRLFGSMQTAQVSSVSPLNAIRTFDAVEAFDAESRKAKSRIIWTVGQHDCNEFLQKLLEFLFVHGVHGSSSDESLRQLFCGSIQYDGSNPHTEHFLQLSLPVAGFQNVGDSLASVLTDVHGSQGQFTQLPNILILHLLRFAIVNGKQTKLTDSYLFPIQLNLGKHVMAGVQNDQYMLHGAVVHSGTDISQGHYWTYVRNGNEWLKFDDESINVIPWTSVEHDCIGGSRTASAYILIYRRLDGESYKASWNVSTDAVSSPQAGDLKQQMLRKAERDANDAQVLNWEEFAAASRLVRGLTLPSVAAVYRAKYGSAEFMQKLNKKLPARSLAVTLDDIDVAGMMNVVERSTSMFTKETKSYAGAIKKLRNSCFHHGGYTMSDEDFLDGIDLLELFTNCFEYSDLWKQQVNDGLIELSVYHDGQATKILSLPGRRAPRPKPEPAELVRRVNERSDARKLTKRKTDGEEDDDEQDGMDEERCETVANGGKEQTKKKDSVSDDEPAQKSGRTGDSEGPTVKTSKPKSRTAAPAAASTVPQPKTPVPNTSCSVS